MIREKRFFLINFHPSGTHANGHLDAVFVFLDSERQFCVNGSECRRFKVTSALHNISKYMSILFIYKVDALGLFLRYKFRDK